MYEAKTVVTACDHPFVWGALLLGLSLRYQGMKSHYHILAYDLSDVESKILNSIPDTKIYPMSKPDTRSVCTQKPMAIATADTDIVVWMDADCMVNGNLEEYFITPDNGLQIRKRNPNEIATIYRDYYRLSDNIGKIPKRVLEIWQNDVADLKRPQIETVYQTNCFVLNNSHRDFINLWQEQMLKVIPSDTKGVYNKHSIAYSMTDESVLNSLMAFSSQAPTTAEYLMDKDPETHCIHFGLKPKPWQHLTLQAYSHMTYIDELIDWARQQEIELPKIPLSLRKDKRRSELVRLRVRDNFRSLRYLMSTQARSILRLFR